MFLFTHRRAILLYHVCDNISYHTTVSGIRKNVAFVLPLSNEAEDQLESSIQGHLKIMINIGQLGRFAANLHAY